ncbi:flagellar motor stator protein MotA [Paralimibaculum aggregatum]|uniref:Flagellar motor stator protein MotA n=1 Tax=Paralimibaculum aggregatum TaxID=3036245 RepID=A0ABQ6LK74_9RHOB|nr:flagellar motor stator protein MotA [Limibaculum sp. NKW23]GMG83644.1 flagellar motor stator protein MotA [Limibaculum sp. NKW23]
MGSIIGIIVVIVMVFGGYLAAGGKLAIILQALPFEFMMIGGAATGAFVIGNDGPTIRHTLKDLGRVFKGASWKREDYQDLLCLLFTLVRIARRDPVAIEAHVEAPEESPVFQAYPRILADRGAVDMICDTIRMSMMNYDDPHQLEDMLEKQLDGRLHHNLHSAHALQVMADGLPALGIVAAVLGVIKTMSAIDQPPEVLGKLIGGALVGTFLGVFLSYGLVGPFASKVKALAEADHKFYELIRDTLVANLHRHSPQICVEVARQNLPKAMRPSFDELETALKSVPEAA